MNRHLFFAFIAGVLALAGCAKDTELYKKVDAIDERLTKLEAQVKELNEQTVPGIRNLIAAIQGNVYATSVVENENGYTIKFSNGTEATITNGEKGEHGDIPVISAEEVDGEFYWTCNGELIQDQDGNCIPVHKTLPTFMIVDGKWQVSYDNGTTWTEVPEMGESSAPDITIEDGEESFTIHIGDETYTISKEISFYLVFEQRTDLGVVAGQTSLFPYTISGVGEEDEVEVDILNIIGSWEAEVVATDNKSGNVKVTNKGGNAKVFVYAANGRGKTDIKSLVFEEGELAATISAESVSCKGGEIVLEITTNVCYDIQIDADWLAVAPDTKATHTDKITLVAESNNRIEPRTANIRVVGDGVNKEFVIIQDAAEELANSYEDFLGKWMLGETLVSVTEKVSGTSYNVNGLIAGVSAARGTSTVEAMFEDGVMTISEQKLGDWMNNQDPCSTWFSGIFASGGNEYPHYTGDTGNADAPATLIYATVDGNNMTFNPGESEFGVAFAGYCVRWALQSEATRGNYFMPKQVLPCTLSRAKEASEAYKKWIGTWQTADGRTLTISEAVADKSFAGTFDEDMADAKISIPYSDGKIVLNSQYLGNGSSSYGSVALFVGGCGWDEDEQELFLIADEYPICTAELNGEANSFTFGKGVYDDGEYSYEIVAITYGALILEGAYAGYTLNYTDILPINLPASFTKVESSTSAMDAIAPAGETIIGRNRFQVPFSLIERKKSESVYINEAVNI